MQHNSLQTDALIQRLPDFTEAAMIIDNSLHDEDVDSLKFLCQGLVVASKLNRINMAIELINLLQSANHVSETDFFLLADLLQYIKRIDVLQNIGYEEHEVMVQRHQQGSKVHPFFVLLFQIAEELPDEDVKKAGYMYGKVPRSQRLHSGKDLFTVMVQHQAISVQNVALLLHIFQSVERQDIVELVNRYIATQGRSVMDDLEQNFARMVSFRGDTTDRIGPREPALPLQPPPQIQAQKGPGFSNGQGLSMYNRDARSAAVRSFSYQESGDSQYSTVNNPPSQQPASPSAPPPSLQHADPSVPVAPSNETPAPYLQPAAHRVQPREPIAPEGYNNYEIPWQILQTLSENIPENYWPKISENLGVPVNSGWSDTTKTANHCLAVLKRWLDLPETQNMNSVDVKVFLVKALYNAGSCLMAQEIAQEMNIDCHAITQESVSSCGSNWNENDVASTGSAAPESMRLNHINSFETAQVGPVTRQMEQMSLHRSPIPYYRMNRIPRGICFIINNRDFFKDPEKVEAKQMISREGTDIDRDKLVSTFQHLNFYVECDNNLKDYEMIQKINTMASLDHSRFDCFVCCILTHGIQGSLYGVNGMTVPIRDLTAPFRAQACPTLSDKPKLFFLQACQGRDKQEGHMRDMQTDAVESDGPPELIPNESDFLLGYATVPGFVSYRSKTRGSWYITKLTELLNKYAYNYDIHDILTLVNYEVGKGDALIEGGQYKQSPAPMYSLRKKLIFVR